MVFSTFDNKARSQRVTAIISALSLEEKAALLAGGDMWSTVGIPRVGLPRIKVTDGPSGARGGTLPGASECSAVHAPSGATLGATWDPVLLERVGAMIGAEARTKAARVLLAPTVNLHRSPLAGRNFECFSEDPVLTGDLAAAYIRGAQSQGVATTVKHYAANDSETERYTTDSIVDERALRELYLVPFERAIQDGGSLGIMTGYNRVNGTWCGEHEWLLRTVLRGDWKFDGFVISDWFAVGSLLGSATAGLDLEMPGTGRAYSGVVAAVADGSLEEKLLDERIAAQLSVWERIGALDDPQEPGPETAIDLPEHRALAREAAAAGTILFTNRDNILPLAATPGSSLAVIGPHAMSPQLGGGGSAQLQAHYRILPLDAITAICNDAVTVTYSRGCEIGSSAPPIDGAMLRCADGSPGLDVLRYDGPAFEGEAISSTTLPNAEWMVVGSFDGTPDDFSARITATFIPLESGTNVLSLIQSGRVRVWLDDELVLDGVENPPPAGTEFFGLGSEELTNTVDLVGGRHYALRIEFSSAHSAILRAFKVGIHASDADALLEQAVVAAANADRCVVFVGTNSEWETEGNDRSTMDLPGRQNELVARVCAANSNTIVVLNTGAPVTLDWLDAPKAVVQAGFGGQEMGNAITDVLFGVTDPGGRLPTTYPVCVEHNPSFGNFPGDNRKMVYGESVLMGYRWYEARKLPVRLPFGHGLSYTTFELSAPVARERDIVEGAPIRVSIDVTNTGTRGGCQVVQAYVAPSTSRLTRPPKELKAFAKVWLDAGETTTVELTFDNRAFAYFDPAEPAFAEILTKQRTMNAFAPSTDNVRTEPGWYIDAGEYRIAVGTSSASIDHEIAVTAPQEIHVPV